MDLCCNSIHVDYKPSERYPTVPNLAKELFV